MGGCCRWGWLVRPGDTPDEARIKTLGFPFALFVFLFSVFLLAHQLLGVNQVVSNIGIGINAFAMLLFMAGVVSNAIPVGHLLDAALILGTLSICFQDLGNATRSSPFRNWTLVVLLLDIALVFKRYHMPRFIIPFVLMYLAALQVESVSRFGLYEAGYW
eukprot:Hpha_TRINITY_DN15384_c3_g1::TRINITY_DN15384_c3_g1_i8::g.88071::m.88071